MLFGSGSVPEYFALKKQHSVEIKMNKMIPRELGDWILLVKIGLNSK